MLLNFGANKDAVDLGGRRACDLTTDANLIELLK